MTLADKDTNHCIQADAHVVSADFDFADVDLNVICYRDVNLTVLMI